MVNTEGPMLLGLWTEKSGQMLGPLSPEVWTALALRLGGDMAEGGGREAKEKEKALTQFKMPAYNDVNF